MQNDNRWGFADLIAVGELCRQGVEKRMRKKHSSD